ncbi:MAG: adenine-specific methyltransferase EcoRI family protein [Christensenellaceae bacterium]|nr:adenine-specific methyltransferase EcoRI family protein [Christensenellaceae bacterium]
MPKKNRSLLKAREVKNDEFYTLLDDIENEILKYDVAQFENKVIYCNCDDPTRSDFFNFFVKWGKHLKIKNVHFTNYSNANPGFKAELASNDNDTTLLEVGVEANPCVSHHWIYTPITDQTLKGKLDGNGDFASPECVSILLQSDIVITNPPFSIFNEYLALVIKHDKKYLIISDDNKLSNPDIFPLIKENKLWLGYTTVKRFLQPDGSYKNFGNKCWYTNLDVSYRKQPISLHVQNISQFKQYENYDALEIPDSRMIPDNYFEPIGVPITFLHKFCPEQFEIIGLSGVDIKIEGGRFYVEDQRLQPRLIIRRKR